MMKDLRELAKEYAQNVIDRETYRKSRSELIQGICAGKIEVETHEYLAPLEDLPEALDDTRENIITQFSQPAKNTATPEKPKPSPAVRPTPKPSPAPTRQPPWIIKQKHIFIGVTAIVLLAIITLIILLLPTTDDSSMQKTEVQIIKNNPGQILITDFIQQKNWSQGSMKSFVTSWQLLSEQELSVATESPEMKRLVNSIYQQLLDERALLSLGDIENAVANQQSLVNFAEELGIDDGRLTVLEPKAKTVDVEIEEVATQTTIDSDIETPNTGNMTEAANEFKEDLIANEESLNVLTEEPLETITATSSQIKPPPAIITESIDSTEKNTAQEISNNESKVNSEETKIITPKPTNKAACKTSLVKSRKPFCRDKIEGAGNGPTMVVIRSGKFTMGGGKEKAEQPAHTVTIGSPFAMSVHEISFGEYEIFCQSENLSCPKQPWSGKDYPVVNVSHNDAASYTEWLSQKTGQSYRLPSEAEWEYAARAGTKTEYPFGDEILITNAVFSDKKKLSAPLPKTDRSINRNKFRLYHMVGNLREWVADSWHDGYSGAPDDGRARVSGANEFVVRGGSYTDSSDALRSGAREKLSSADKYTGFRVLQELSE